MTHSLLQRRRERRNRENKWESTNFLRPLSLHCTAYLIMQPTYGNWTVQRHSRSATVVAHVEGANNRHTRTHSRSKIWFCPSNERNECTNNGFLTTETQSKRTATPLVLPSCRLAVWLHISLNNRKIDTWGQTLHVLFQSLSHPPFST